MTLTIKLDGNWSSFQLANNTPPLSVTGSVIAPSARMHHDRAVSCDRNFLTFASPWPLLSRLRGSGQNLGLGGGLSWALARARTRTYTHTHTQVHIHNHIHEHTQSTRARTHRHTCAQARTQTHTSTHTQAHAHQVRRHPRSRLPSSCFMSGDIDWERWEPGAPPKIGIVTLMRPFHGNL